jgi:zinc finger protein
MSEITKQLCQFCGEKKLTLREEEVDIPHFGRVYVLSMDCGGCHYHKADVEPAEMKEPCKFTLEVDSEEDLEIKVVKSGEATLKIPHIITMEPGPASSGYITNVEGVLERVKKILQSQLESEDDDSARKKLKNMVKKISKVIMGREKTKIILEDKTGHSAIISDKATRSKL